MPRRQGGFLRAWEEHLIYLRLFRVEYDHSESNEKTEDMEEMKPSWYCARTKPKNEHIAAACVDRLLELEVFHPRLRMERATRRGPVRVVEPVFPGYIFVRCTAADQLEEVRYVNGISSLVHFGVRTATVPDAVIADLKQCFEAGEPLESRDELKPGEEVTVMDGAFLGFRGIVVRALPAVRRVQILLEFLGRMTMAEVERGSVVSENQSPADRMPALARA